MNNGSHNSRPRLRLVPPVCTSDSVPCPSWCNRPAGHRYEWDADAFTRIHECWFGDDSHGVRLLAAAYVKRVGDAEELVLEDGLLVELPREVLDGHAARKLAADLLQAAELLEEAVREGVAVDGQ